MKYPFLLLVTVVSSFCACNNGSETAHSGDTPAVAETIPPFTEKEACVLSQLSYCDSPQKLIAQYMPGWSVVWNGLETGSNYAFVASNGYHHAVAIRGSLMTFTEGALNNWLYQDMNVLHQKVWKYTDSAGGEALISKGVFDGWSNMDNMKERRTGTSLTAFLLSLPPEKGSLQFTGHSLGGNIASVYSSYIWNRYKEAGKKTAGMNVITFAAPAAGNDDFAADFNRKFPASLRIENEYDIVPKFPCRESIDELGELFPTGPSASQLSISYRGVSVSLADAFSIMSKALLLLTFTGDDYQQTNSGGKQIKIPLSGKNPAQDINAWFAEAGYHHGIAQYATHLGAPVVKECQ
jgi:triacylglycerol lipase